MDEESGKHPRHQEQHEQRQSFRVCGINKRKQVVFSGQNAGEWGGAFATSETGKNVWHRRALNAVLTGLDFINWKPLNDVKHKINLMRGFVS